MALMLARLRSAAVSVELERSGDGAVIRLDDGKATARLVDHVFSRPPGEVGQELGGVGLTVLALAETVGLSADQEERAELWRVRAECDRREPTERHADDHAGVGCERADGLRDVTRVLARAERSVGAVVGADTGVAVGAPPAWT